MKSDTWKLQVSSALLYRMSLCSTTLGKVIAIVYFALNILPLTAIAQDLIYQNYDLKSGLPSEIIYQSLQDSKGFTWFASDNGASRFDGYDFENFNKSDGLTDNEVLSIFEDSQGRIWFLTFNGIPSFWYDNKIYNPDNTPALADLTFDDYLIDIYENELGEIIILCVDGTIKKYGKNNEVTSYGRKGYSFNLHYKAPFTYLINGNDQGLIQLDAAFNKTSEDHQWNWKLNIRHNASLLIDDELIFLAADNYISVRNIAKKEIVAESNPPVANILGVFFIDNLYWIATKNGVFSFELKGKTFVQKAHYLWGISISSVSKDFEGNLWFSSMGNGVFYKPTYELSRFRQPNFDNLKNVQCIKKGKGRSLIVGYADGQLSLINHGQIKTFDLADPSTRNTFNINDIAETTDGGIFITCSNGFKYIDIDQKIYHQPILSFKSIFIDSKNHLWGNGPSGMHVFDVDSLIQFLKKPSADYPTNRSFIGKHLRQFGRVEKIYDLQNGNVLSANNEAIYQLTDNGKNHLISKKELDHLRVNDFLQFDDGSIWIASQQNGIQVLQNEKSFPLALSVELGIKKCNKLYRDESGLIWMATDVGIIRYNEEQPDHYTLIPRENGMSNSNIRNIAVIGDTVWLASNDGLIFFDKSETESLKQYEQFAPVYIKEFKASGRSVVSERYFDYNQNNFQIDFVGLSYANHQDLQYRYRLSANESWRYTRNKSIELSSLSPGKYNFEVSSSNNGIEWNPDSAKITFTIEKPLWKKVWFTLLVAIAIISIAYVLINRKYANLKKQAALEKKASLLKTEVLLAQINPHFLFNSLTAIQGFLYQENPMVASKYLSKFSNLVRLILEQSREKWISVSEEIKVLQLYLELQQLRFENKFEYQFQVDNNVSVNTIMLPPMLTQPFVENAIEHGILPLEGSGKIRIELSSDSHSLTILIKDNGIGLNAPKPPAKSKDSSKKKSLGIDITKERLEVLFNKDYQLEIREMFDEHRVAGTLVRISIPIDC
ncbi:MAG: histidine kinase [Bacteroidota bacterium]